MLIHAGLISLEEARLIADERKVQMQSARTARSIDAVSEIAIVTFCCVLYTSWKYNMSSLC